MIALHAECLLFQTTSGESMPFSADMISAELLGDQAKLFDAEFVRDAAKAVFHYFRHELGRQTVSVGEFALALEKVLRGFALTVQQRASGADPGTTVLELDLCRLAGESGGGCELFFFPRLRDELRRRVRQAPRVLRFRGLRGCVKQLAGARRWNLRCRQLEERIVEYLRECLSAEAGRSQLALVVE
jgi:hypothetical protein